MSPKDALEKQLERYRQMTGEQRLQIALNLHKLACAVAMDGNRRQFPEADDAAVERELRRRIQLAYSCAKKPDSPRSPLEP
jgi:hypothetical protein